MDNPTVSAKWSSGPEVVYEFETAPTREQMDAAMDHLGGKPKRGSASVTSEDASPE